VNIDSRPIYETHNSNITSFHFIKGILFRTEVRHLLQIILSDLNESDLPSGRNRILRKLSPDVSKHHHCIFITLNSAFSFAKRNKNTQVSLFFFLPDWLVLSLSSSHSSALDHNSSSKVTSVRKRLEGEGETIFHSAESGIHISVVFMLVSAQTLFFTSRLLIIRAPYLWI
jgi:hypothetical protein